MLSLSPEATHAAISTYAALYLTGSHILLPVLLAITLSARSLRHPVLLNLCIASIFQGIVACLVLYANGYIHAIPRSLCLVQAALVWAAAPMVTSAGLMLVFHTWLSVRASIDEEAEHKPKRLVLDPMYQSTMILFPYILLVFFSLAGVATVIKDPSSVTLTRRVLYCAAGHGGYSMFVAGVNAAIVLLTVYVEVLLGLALYRVLSRHNWQLASADRDAPFDLCFALRVFFSGVYILITCGFAIFAVVRASVVPDIFAGTVAIFIAVMFGSRWVVWRAVVALWPWTSERVVKKNETAS